MIKYILNINKKKIKYTFNLFLFSKGAVKMANNQTILTHMSFKGGSSKHV